MLKVCFVSFITVQNIEAKHMSIFKAKGKLLTWLLQSVIALTDVQVLQVLQFPHGRNVFKIVFKDVDNILT